MDKYFAREAEIMDIVYDLNKDCLRMFTFERNIVLFKSEIIIFHVPLSSIYILVLYILRNIKKIFITSVTKVHGLDNQQSVNA